MIDDPVAIAGFFVIVLRLVLGAIFLFAGLSKLNDPLGLSVTMRSLRIVPAWASRWAARGVIWLEMLLGTLLIFGLHTRLVVVTAVGVLLGFVIVVGVALARGTRITCNCFGPYFKETIGPNTLIRNMFLIAAGVLIVIFYDGGLSLDYLLRIEFPSHTYSILHLVGTVVTASCVLVALATLATLATLSQVSKPQ